MTPAQTANAINVKIWTTPKGAGSTEFRYQIKTVSAIMKREFKRNLWTKLRALLCGDIIKKIRGSLDYEAVGGAMFLGLKKAVVKGHGNSKARGFSVCIAQAANAVRGQMVEKIAGILETSMASEEKVSEEKAE